MPRRFEPTLGLVVAVATLMLLLVGCHWQPERAAGPIRVVVSIPPLAGLIRPLLPADASITMLIQPGRSEHGYEFTARDVAALAQADLVFYVGMGLEPQVASYLRDHPSKSRRDLCLADAVGISVNAVDAHEGHDREEEGHEHGGVDPHIWLDPSLVAKAIPQIKAAVLAALQESKSPPDSLMHAESAASKLQSDLAAFDDQSKAMLTSLSGREIVTHHAAWGRFAEHFGLKVAAVIRPIETSESTPDTINKAVAAIKDQGVRAIFVEPQFNGAAAERLAREAGVKLGTLDPLGDGDWFKMMRANVDSIVKALGP